MLLPKDKITEDLVVMLLSWRHSGFNVFCGPRIQPGEEKAKIYPLTCPKCSGEMKVISVIEDEEVIKKILKHLGLWEIKSRPPPKIEKSTKVVDPVIDCSDSQVPSSDEYLYYDVEFPVEDPDLSGEVSVA